LSDIRPPPPHFDLWRDIFFDGEEQFRLSLKAAIDIADRKTGFLATSFMRKPSKPFSRRKLLGGLQDLMSASGVRTDEVAAHDESWRR